MLLDFIDHKETEQINAAFLITKEIFGENLPFIVEYVLDGKVVIFNDHFIRTSREALTNGCMAKMNEDEAALFMAFIDYENGSINRDITTSDDKVLEALDQWFMDEIRCNPHKSVNACYDKPKHTWRECGITV